MTGASLWLASVQTSGLSHLLGYAPPIQFAAKRLHDRLQVMLEIIDAVVCREHYFTDLQVPDTVITLGHQGG